MHPHIVQVEHLTKRYGSFAALDGCSLTIPTGSVFGLLGPNGAGKTTLIRCLMGYLKPTSGAARIDGLDCRTQSLEIRRRVSYLPAESKLFRLMRGRQCIEFFASVHPRGDMRRALDIAEQLDLDLNRRVAFMSTGMRQKLAICCVMSCRGQLMILDEPTANLDPTVRSTVLRLVREARRDGSTIAFCSHVLSEIEEICDRAAILRRGQVVHTLDLAELRTVHRIRGELPPDAHIDIDQFLATRGVKRMVNHSTIAPNRIVFELEGPLESHLPWLVSMQLREIQIESTGLQGVYDRFHPPQNSGGAMST